MKIKATLLALALAAAPLAASAQDPVDLEMMTRIRQEGLQRSKVMDTARHLTDEIGPRLTGSPAMEAAAEWVRSTLAGWGLANAHVETYPFGRGWTFSDVDVHMVEPVQAPLFAYPKAWTPGTEGTVQAAAIRADISSEKDFDTYRGKLAGKIVLLDEPRPIEPPDNEVFRRYTDQELEDLIAYPIRDRDGGAWAERRQRYLKRMQFADKLIPFLREEGVLATIEISDRDGGLVTVGGTRAYKPGSDLGVPGLVMAAEHYDRLCRMLDNGDSVVLAVNVAAQFLAETTAPNVVAEIPGGDLKDQVVMAGAHLDSWHAGTGATDNAAGTAVVMEAVRILKALGVTPRRTIRVGLWSGEEQGLLGSRAYVKEHFASRAEPTDPEQRKIPEWARSQQGALETRPEWKKLDVYFNIDNGSGKLRGVYTQGNSAARPIFSAWLDPLADLGADTVTMRDTGGTDHLSFDAVGLPGFQFIQDGLDYFSRTHHTEMDVYDRLQSADMKQASVVLAAFLYDAAMQPEMFPRKPLPPEDTTPAAAKKAPTH